MPSLDLKESIMNCNMIEYMILLAICLNVLDHNKNEFGCSD